MDLRFRNLAEAKCTRIHQHDSAFNKKKAQRQIEVGCIPLTFNVSAFLNVINFKDWQQVNLQYFL